MSDTKKTKQVVDIISQYLNNNSDLDELRSIVSEFDSLLEQEEKLNTAVITTAFKIDTQLQECCEQILKGMFGSDLEFEYVVNPQILGGLKVKVYDQVIDFSVDTSLNNIAKNLKQ